MTMTGLLFWSAGVAARAALPLLLAAMITLLLMRRRAAAERHLVWSAAVVGALLVPVLAFALPSWDVALPVPSWARVSSDVISSRDVINADIPVLSTSSSDALPVRTVELNSTPVVADKPANTRVISTTTIVLSIWLLGALAVLARAAIGFARLRPVVRAANPVRDPALVLRARVIATDLGIDSPVRLLEGSHDAMPMTFGVLRPALLLPSAARTWTPARQDAVLRHELAHIRRRDTLVQLIAEIGCVLYWFNPLMWIAAHRLCVEREHACDDAVIMAGSRGSDYATELLDIARTMQAQRTTRLAAIAMARPSQLRARLAAVLDERTRRDSVGVKLLVPVWTAALAVMIPVSSGHFHPRLAAPAHDKVKQQDAWSFANEKPEATTSQNRATSLATMIANRAGISPAAFTAALAPIQEDCLTNRSDNRTSVNINSDDDRNRRTMKWSGRDCSGEVVINGDVQFDAAFTTITGLSSGGEVRIETKEGNAERRLVMRPGAGGLTYEYSVNGDRRSFDDAGRQWLSSTLTFMFRRMGFMAKERATAILARGGPDALLTEVGLLSGDYVRSAYLTVLVAQGRLDEASLRRVLDLAGRTIESDHYKTAIITAVAGQYTLTDGVRTAYIAATTGLDSDHYRHQAFTTLLKKGNLSSAQVSAVLRESGRIDSDHYRASLLNEMADKYRITPEIRAAYMDAARGIEGDHYKAAVLTGLLKSGLNATDVASVADAAATLEGDHYKAQVLTSYLKAAPLSDATTQRAFVRATAGMDGDHYLQGVLSSIVKENTVEPAVLNVVLDAAAGLEGDHYRAALLTDIASKYRLEGATRDKFIKLMEEMSDHYQGNLARILLRNSR